MSNHIALPAGWANHYRTNDGGDFVEPPPGLLLQKSGGETRVVFASYKDGHLTAACDNRNYVDSAETARSATATATER